MSFDPDDALNARPDKVVALDKLLAKLVDCDLSDWDSDFVDDMIKRLEKRGNAMVATGLQEEQLERMRRQYHV